MPVPVLQVHGAHDGLRSPAWAALTGDESDRLCAGYRYELLTRVGHFPAEQAPAEVNLLLTDWLGDLP